MGTQYQLFQEMVAVSNINLVECGNCGSPIFHRRRSVQESDLITCWACKEVLALSDCPDFYIEETDY